MSITQFSEQQLQILQQGLEKINDLFALLNKFAPSMEASHSAMRLQEGFMWLEQVVKGGVMILDDINKEKLDTVNSVDEQKK